MLKKLLRFGGVKLKLMSFVFFTLVLATIIQNSITVPLMQSYIEKKAFEISTATIERVSDFSSSALLERTIENRLSLDDAIKKIQLSSIDGLVGVSIYQRLKTKIDVKFDYIAGFGDTLENRPFDKKLINSLSHIKDDRVISDDYLLVGNNKSINTYRFVKPTIYTYQKKKVLLGVTILYYDKKSVSNIIDKMTEYMIDIAVAVLLLSIIFVYFVGVRFTRPLLELTKAASSITHGNFDIKLDIKRNDEIGYLAYHFKEMIESLKEKGKMKKYMSNSTMDMIKENPNKNMALGGKYKTVTFLFCDIRNFTALSERESPSDVINIVNFYLDLQTQIIKKHNGDIDKYIGDEIMASFSGEEATEQALECSVEIQKTLAEENLKRGKLDKIICEVGIGINRGEVIVGNVGSQEHMDFTSIGLAVNIASRLCSSAKANKIIIDKATYDSSTSLLEVESYEQFNVKGVSYLVDTYSIRVRRY